MPEEGKARQGKGREAPQVHFPVQPLEWEPIGTGRMTVELVSGVSAGDKRPWNSQHSLQSVKLCQGSVNKSSLSK